mgnify:CR=1 FL=1
MLNKNSSKQILKDMRITVKNILFVIGLPPELANKSEEELMSEEYFGQYGKILKLTKKVIHQLKHSHLIGPNFMV